MSSITDLLTTENEYYDSQHIPGFVQGVVVENNNAKFKGMVRLNSLYGKLERTCVNGFV